MLSKTDVLVAGNGLFNTLNIKENMMNATSHSFNDWYSLTGQRMADWDKNGLSLKEAEAYLMEYFSDFPAAGVEVGKYIAENWTSRRVKMLNPRARQILIQVCNDYELVINEGHINR